MTLAEQVASIKRTVHRLLTRRLSKRTDRPFMQMLALKVIDGGEVQSQASLAERLLVDPPAVSRLVDRLVEDGLMKRCAGQDRRCVRLEVTAAGRKEVAVYHAELERLEADARKHLTAQELKTLRQLLEKLQTGLSESGDADSAENEGK
jgi:MarR family transcriptional regulator, transcriptional regulator for hemolysin